MIHPDNENFRLQVLEATKKFQNPFLEAALWIRGEMLDIQGMLNAIKGRQGVIDILNKAEEAKRDDMKELESL